jgi:hypothetical protein
MSDLINKFQQGENPTPAETQERARDILAQALLSQQIEARVALRKAAQGALYRAVYAATPAVAVSNALLVMSTYKNPVFHGMGDAGMAALNRENERAWQVFASTDGAWEHYAGTATAPLMRKNLKLHTRLTLKNPLHPDNSSLYDLWINAHLDSAYGLSRPETLDIINE